MNVYFAIHAGLGNQLFQYAAGLYAERQWGIPIRYCAVAPRRDNAAHPRSLLLDRFNLSKPIEYPGYIIRRSMQGKKFMAIKKAIHFLCGMRLIDEHTLYIRDPLFDTLPAGGRVVYRGFWQSLEYITENGDRLRRELQLRHKPAEHNAALLHHILSTPSSVSVHVRRGDYNQVANGSILLPIDYYNAAMKRMLERRPDAHFFVFSDDPDWIREALSETPRITIAEGNDEDRCYEDLRLMAACQNHIIANSSFSWWGAWLGMNPGKTVILPKFWMGRMPTPKGLIEAGWELL